MWNTCSVLFMHNGQEKGSTIVYVNARWGRTEGALIATLRRRYKTGEILILKACWHA